MTTSHGSALNTRDLKPRVGTEVRTDKATLLSGAHAETARELLEQRGVLVFPQIGFTDDEQIAFAETLGVFAAERTGEKLYNVTHGHRARRHRCTVAPDLAWHNDPTTDTERGWIQAHIDQTPDSSLLKRYGTLDEQAAAICFLALDEAGYITGSVLPVSGGDQG